ncbi:SCA7-domain-containing protein [Piedraia hortae CBS 480.64]|uniref:SCA7-domain-containing protein n=1 Tax=Piedraia hortae CBS 480.64 TaxID=1314780 RepID=A0A6A7C5Q8_9PEZI|nr:SCA7-domain-containing protein [Piedraia hortae CBS 480.64]
MAPPSSVSRKAPGKSAPSLSMTPPRSLETAVSTWPMEPQPQLSDSVALPTLERPGFWHTKTLTKPSAPTTMTQSTTHSKALPKIIIPAFPAGYPMTDELRTLKCTHCKRPVLHYYMKAHIGDCLNKKQEKQRKKKEARDARDATLKEPTTTTTTTTSSKKRRLDDSTAEGGGSKKKKSKKLEPAASKPTKPTKVKAPVDVEKQCGVELPNGGQCARSLTCKSHSMGAKRSVPGRSAPYDKLLMEYQRKNQAKLTKAAIDANAPDPEEERERDRGPVDEDQETETIMNILASRWGGRPVYVHQPIRAGQRAQHNRIRAMLAGANIFSAGSRGLPFGTVPVGNRLEGRKNLAAPG